MQWSNDKMYFYDSFADQFDKKMNMYDTKKRLKLIFEKLLTEDLRGKYLLDAGCGTGWFSKKAVDLGANVVSLDVGDNILAEVAKKCDSTRVKGSVLNMKFGNDVFDIVICTEVIEHTPNPKKAIQEICKVVKNDGLLILTVPNKIWHFSVVIANLLRLRPYEGFENWVDFFKLKNWLKEAGFIIEEIIGFHIVPFISPRLYGIIDYFDKYGRQLGPIMLNIAVKARKICDEENC